MHLRSILSGTLAIFLLSGAAAHARDSVGLDIPFPKVGLPGVFGSKGNSDSSDGMIQLAQAGDPRVTALEEQIRKLNGSIEELNFQILQMQEQMRKMQEDNEFRFQELEGGTQKKSDASGNSNSSIVEAPAAPQPDTTHQTAATGTSAPAGGGQSVEEVIVESGTGEPGQAAPDGTGTPPTTFGTITVDANGNVISTTTDEHASSDQTAQPAAPAASGSNGAVVASLPSTDDPDELYRNSYQFVLSGDYTTAEQGFRDHIARFPADPKTADARFWLGESLLGQKRFRDAAEIFLSSSKEYPKSKKAPEMMLKLGVSLVNLKQREVACATFGEIGKRYPDISGALKERVKQERALAAC
ncbi:tol-pal system protein YbgF [Mesorhizobium sp. ANAO-SY3R2]|uniref:tol-pal system protein YbgF n=1 Tax=Mesorhizobium sp. ANAO-SY3R2 TaxID=3166644 RepID=UPI0036733410